MASALPSLSSASSSLLQHSFAGNSKGSSQFSNKSAGLLVFAQKKSKKTRKVYILHFSIVHTLNQTLLGFWFCSCTTTSGYTWFFSGVTFIICSTIIFYFKFFWVIYYSVALLFVKSDYLEGRCG